MTTENELVAVADRQSEENVSAKHKAYYASPDAKWVTGYPLSEDDDSDWCVHEPCSLDNAIWLMVAGIAFGEKHDFDDYDFDGRTPLDIKNECLEVGCSSYQEGTYPWIIKVERKGFPTNIELSNHPHIPQI